MFKYEADCSFKNVTNYELQYLPIQYCLQKVVIDSTVPSQTEVVQTPPSNTNGVTSTNSGGKVVVTTYRNGVRSLQITLENIPSPQCSDSAPPPYVVDSPSTPESEWLYKWSQVNFVHNISADHQNTMHSVVKCKHNNFDTKYGVREVDENLFVGHSEFTVDDRDIVIDGLKYKATPGFYELLFKKKRGNLTLKTCVRDILRRTNSYKVNYDPNKLISASELIMSRELIKEQQMNDKKISDLKDLIESGEVTNYYLDEDRIVFKIKKKKKKDMIS
ncbi:hypothetical protein RN001_001773 [Aquatica leii]|uniref:DUF8207 domain-containing protein n=1 Tax=Aquatica leii TaxID=1421715 RepID=A0AAN7Q833_9COLE|nr:hypothetical protein RN001_001773 [Aquatica leii]